MTHARLYSRQGVYSLSNSVSYHPHTAVRYCEARNGSKRQIHNASQSVVKRIIGVSTCSWCYPFLSFQQQAILAKKPFDVGLLLPASPCDSSSFGSISPASQLSFEQHRPSLRLLSGSLQTAILCGRLRDCETSVVLVSDRCPFHLPRSDPHWK